MYHQWSLIKPFFNKLYEKGLPFQIDVGKTLGPDYSPQVSYLNRKIVPYGTKGSVRPDFTNGTTFSVEVKNYNLSTNQGGLINNVVQQALQRQQHLPIDMNQQIRIDIRGQSVPPMQQAKIISDINKKSDGIIHASQIRFIGD